MDFDLILTFMAGAAIAAAAGVLGVFAVMKRMALAGDVLSHVAFPGVALALTFSFSPSLGAALFLFGAAYAIWAVRTRTDRKSTRLNSSHMSISYAVFCLKKR